MVAIFKGFSTADQIRPPYTLEGFDLVKQDLINHFYTRKGERLMRPEYGSVIWDLIMNPQDPNTEQLIRDDVKRIISTDPRVDHLSTTIYTLDHAIRVEVELKYVLLNTTDVLYLDYVSELEGLE